MEDIKHWSYDLLKEIASKEETPSPSYLEELKSFYAPDIDSVRRLDCIRSTADLIDCLERRDICSEENVEPLRHCGGERLQEAISNYVLPNHEDMYSPDPVNQYQEQRLVESVHQQLNLNGGLLINDNVKTSRSQPTTTTMAASPNPAALTERKRAAIYKKISQEIGNFWRRFGRELSIGEGAMDQIELLFPRDLPSRVYKLLQLFEEDDCNDPKKHAVLICRALEKCQRKDLRRKVEDIMCSE